MGGEATVPSPRGLLEAIERFVEAADVVQAGAVNETSRLRTIDRNIECPVEKGIVDVKLMNGPLTRDSKTETTRMVVGLMTGLKVSS